MQTKAIKYISGLEEWFTTKVNTPGTILLFKKAVYVFILFNGLITLPIAPEIWSPFASMIHYYPTDNLAIKLMNILSRPSVNNYYWFFVIGQLFCAAIALVGYQKQLMGVLLYFITANLYYNSGLIQNGGTNLLMITLFYMMFMNEDADKYKNGTFRTIAISFSNFALLAAQFQVCLLYIVSSVYKLHGSHWIDGSALYYILNIDEYSTAFIQKYVANTDWITVPATYLTLTFQLLFPVTVWIKKLKPITLVTGIAFHLLIIFMMGLTDFGLIMIVMYLLFFSNAVSLKLLNNFQVTM